MPKNSYEINDRVKCLATYFDKNTEDSHGFVFSQRHLREGHGEWCFGTVKRVLRDDFYSVLYDGDSKRYKCHSRTLQLHERQDTDDDDDDGQYT